PVLYGDAVCGGLERSLPRSRAALAGALARDHDGRREAGEPIPEYLRDEMLCASVKQGLRATARRCLVREVPSNLRTEPSAENEAKGAAGARVHRVVLCVAGDDEPPAWSAAKGDAKRLA